MLRLRVNMGHIIAVVNQKGGVGKTTTVINLASYLGKLKKTVLIIDIDPQGNATSGLGINKNLVSGSTTEFLLGHMTLKQAVVQVEPKVDIVPTGQSLAALELELVNVQAREFKLKQALQGCKYDYVLIDCPPSLSLLTVNALTAADSVLIPVQTEFYALEGLSQLLEIVGLIKKGLNPDLELLGVVLTMYDSRTTLSEQVRLEVANHFGDKVFNTVIPRNVRLAEAPSYGKSISSYDKWSKGAKSYKALAKEFQRRTTA